MTIARVVVSVSARCLMDPVSPGLCGRVGPLDPLHDGGRRLRALAAAHVGKVVSYAVSLSQPRHNLKKYLSVTKIFR